MPHRVGVGAQGAHTGQRSTWLRGIKMGPETGVWVCEVCGKPVSRLLGMAGAVSLTAGGVQLRSVVHGYCAAHREAVRRAFSLELEAVGQIEWLGEPAAELKPREALAWQRYADRELSGGLDPDRGYVASRDESCPHCAVAVSWGVGPHVSDAAARPGALAWQCRGCGAAGLAHRLP